MGIRLHIAITLGVKLTPMGQRPRKASRPSPTLKGSIAVAVSGHRSCDPFRVGTVSTSLSGGAAPGYHLLPFRGGTT
jgi:hypothetical protein